MEYVIFDVGKKLRPGLTRQRGWASLTSKSRNIEEVIDRTSSYIQLRKRKYINSEFPDEKASRFRPLFLRFNHGFMLDTELHSNTKALRSRCLQANPEYSGYQRFLTHSQYR